MIHGGFANICLSEMGPFQCFAAIPLELSSAKLGPFDFSTPFHSRIKPINPRPALSILATSATPIRTRATRSNDNTVHDAKILTIGNYRATMSCERKGLSVSDDLGVTSVPSAPRHLATPLPHIIPNIVRDLLFPPSILNCRLSTSSP
jgi:hypothetical protein